MAASSPYRQNIAVISLAHSVSHLFQLVLPPLFPWIKQAFGLSYAELGLLMSCFFVASALFQAVAGFLVDHIGPLPVLLGGLVLLALAAVGWALAPSYAWMLVFCVLAGLGNSVFHPADFSLLNHLVPAPKLGWAFSVHGLSGSMGWALAPLLMVALAQWQGYRTALLCAAVIAAAVAAVVLFQRRHLQVLVEPASATESRLAFLRLPALWWGFGFFVVTALSLSGIQHFTALVLSYLHPISFVEASSLISLYMLASAGGVLLGGFLATRISSAETVVAVALGVSGLGVLGLSWAWSQPWMLALLMVVVGGAAGVSGPSRDLLVRQVAPAGATGRVYGVVYSGFDVGLALAPLPLGYLMDHQHYRSVLWAMAAAFWLALAIAASMKKALSNPSG